jgi:CheY-like chemotaxis protein
MVASPALRVAVVDDDDGIRRLVARVFSPPDYAVQSYRNGREALEGIGHAPPDVVVCDLNMPGLQGDAFCRELQVRLGTLAPPVVILSCAGDEESVGAALEAGALHYVTKPFAPGHLRKLVDHAARAGRPVSRATPRRSRDTIGPYRIVDELGRGGMGVVYRAVREDTGQEVALKVRTEGPVLGHDTGRFVRELSLLASLDHPGIARFVDSGTDDKLIYYAMEFVPGTTLAAAIAARGRLPWQEVATFGRETANALAYVHGRNVLHRDIKPGNIVLVPGARSRLIDFGLARRPHDPGLTDKHEVVGTLSYLGPEVIDSGLHGPEGDVFALGVCLYEALRGSHPFDAPPGASAFAVTEAFRAGRLPRLLDVVPTVPSELARVIERALAPKPVDRPTAAALEVALAELAATA